MIYKHALVFMRGFEKNGPGQCSIKLSPNVNIVCVLLTPSGGSRPFLVNLVRGTRKQHWW
jgi:hypothetical protein